MRLTLGLGKGTSFLYALCASIRAFSAMSFGVFQPDMNGAGYVFHSLVHADRTLGFAGQAAGPSPDKSRAISEGRTQA
jgi:hypothetical protein